MPVQRRRTCAAVATWRRVALVVPSPLALEQLPIAIVGCGGLGVPAAWTLAFAGCRRLTLVDDDCIELSNLHRQVLYPYAAIGLSKAEQLATALQARFGPLDIRCRQLRVTAGTVSAALNECAAVVECTDDAASKFIVNDWLIANRARTGTIAAAIGRGGQWFTVSRHTSCYRCLFQQPPDPEVVATCSVAGVLGPVVGAVGSWAARSLLAAVQGQPDAGRGALVRFSPRGLLRTPVGRAADCICADASYRDGPAAHNRPHS